MRDRSRRSYPGSGARPLIFLAALVLLAGSALAAPADILNPTIDGDSPVTVGGDKSSSGTVEIVTSFNGEVWASFGGVWRDLEYLSSEDLNDIDGQTLENIWVCGDTGARRYNGFDWGAIEDLGGLMRGIMVRSDGVVACGDVGRVMRRQNGSWTNLASGTNDNFFGIWGTSADDFWVCGANGRIQRYQDGDWTTIASGTSETLRSVWGDVGVGPFFVGDNGTILRWDDGQIEPMTSGTSENFSGVDGTSGENVWAVGTGWVAVRYDGSSWTNMNAPGSFNLQDVSALPSGKAITVDANGNIPTFNGATWQTFDIGPDIFLTGIVSVPSDDENRWWDGFASSTRGGLGLNSGDFQGNAINLAVAGDELVAFGSFTRGGENTALQNIATFDGTAWTELDPVENWNFGELLTVHDGDITFCGYVEGTLGVYAWDEGGWEMLGPPLETSEVNPITLRSFTMNGIDRLFLTGVIPRPDDENQSTVLEYIELADEWIPLGSGMPGPAFCYSLEVWENDLYVAGEFSSDPPNAGRVYRLALGNPLGTWESVLATDEFTPIALVVHQDELYVSGGQATNVDVLRKFDPDGPSWDPQGVIIQSGFVFEMQSWGDRIILMGSFTSLSDVASPNVCYWEDGDVLPLSSGCEQRVNDGAVFGGDLYVGGTFATAGGVESYGIARWRDDGQSFGPPTVTLNVPDAGNANSLIPITADVESFQTVHSVRLAYRAFDADDFEHVEMAPTSKADGTYEATIPGAEVSEYGVQYFVTVQTDQYTVTSPPNPAEQAAFVGIEINNAEWPAPLPLRYELMGVPFAAAGSMAQIFEDDLGAYDPSRWRMERWNPGTESYVPYPAVEPVAPGRGYWLIQADPVVIDVSGATTSTSGGTDITLQPGWNMIAAPYLFPVPWSEVSLPAGVEDALIGRTNDQYVDVNTLVPWRGYFVFHGGVTPAVINVPATEPSKSAIPERDLRDVAGCDWTVAIAASQGERMALTKVVGALAAGTDRPSNLHQPPALEHDLALWIETEQDGGLHKLRRDLRTIDDGAVWELVVRPAADEAAPVTLAFEGLEDVPTDLTVALATPQGTIDLREAAGAWTAPAGGQTRVRLVVGDPELVEEAQHTLPQPFALLPNYPNPFNPATRVVFTLPRDGEVTVELFNVAGRHVRTLVDEVRPAGRHEVLFDGTDDRGRGLASGVYFVRMQADDFAETRKMTLVR